MSLQVWMPLNGNLINQGLASATISGTPAYGEGKIGQALDLINSAQITISCSSLANTSQFSICFWIKGTMDTDDADWAAPINFTANKTDGTENSNFRFGKKNADSGGYPIGMFNNTNFPISTSGYAMSTSDNWDNWIHACFTTNGTTIKTYLNGVNFGTYETGTNGWLTGTIRLRANRYNGFLNDFRVYNHVLSDEEIKEISKGKVLHYTLNRRPDGPGNLIMNGFGELGTTNWNTTSKVFTDDLPTADTTIKARFVSNINTTEFIPLHRNQTYEISLYVKASSTSGSCYPSIIPYDIDKNQINYRNTKAGFYTDTMTTLKQQLKAGDTKIYVNDLSAWSTAANYRNYAAIFGYKDSTGYTYPDGVYTRNTPAFWSGNTEVKTTLDKTNNIITLNEAYSGETIPVGRSICQATAGAVYFYPFGAVANSGIADWTLKTTTFSSEHNYLSAARYMRFCMYSSSMCAGVKLTNQGRESTVYDISGLNNNGQMISTLSYATNSPRYKTATIFNGVNSAIAAGRSGMVRDAITISLWGYMTDWSTYAQRMISCTEGGGWNFEPGSSKMRFACGTGATSNTYKTITSTKTLASLSSGWHMFTGTYDGFQQKIYIDGVLEGTNDAYTEKTPLYYHSSNGVFVGAEAGSSSTTPASGYYFNGYISDVRVYATALSAQDIQDLYNGLF